MKRLILFLIIGSLQITYCDLLFAQSNNQNPMLNRQEYPRKEEKTRNLSLPEDIFDTLIAKAEANGSIRVTVDVNSIMIRNVPTKQMMESQWRLQQRREKIRKELLDQLARFNVRDIERGANADRITMTVDADALKFLKKKYINDIAINEAPAKEEISTISREKRDARIDELIKKAEVKGTISVIVGFKGMGTADSEAIEAREKILEELAKYDVKVTTETVDSNGMKSITKYVTMQVNADALRFMKNQPFIESIGENGIRRPTITSRRAQ
jgi:hypothetical protein